MAYFANHTTFQQLKNLQGMLHPADGHSMAQITWATGIIAALVLWLFTSWFRQEEALEKGLRKLKPPPGPSLQIPLLRDDTVALLTGNFARGAERHRDYGDIYTCCLLGRRTVCVGGFDNVRKLLMSEHDLVETCWPPSVQKLLGPNALSNLEFGAHDKLKKQSAAAYAPRALRSYAAPLQAITQKYCKSWAAAGSLQLQPQVKRLTFEIAMEVIIGLRQPWLSEERVVQLQDLFTTWLDGLFSIPINVPGFGFHKALQAREQILVHLEDGIKALQEGMRTADPSRTRTALEIMMETPDEEGSLPTMDMLKEMCLTLAFAGHDTSAATLTCLVHRLATQPALMDRLRQEQQAVVAAHGTAFTDEALRAMPFTEALAKELLRHRTIVREVSRRALKTFSLGGYRIDKGTPIQVHLWDVHDNDPRWAGEAGELALAHFNPDRWLSPEGAKAGAWMPFGAGVRMCLGYQFAMMEIKVVLSELARGYSWTLQNPDEKFTPFPLPVPVEGMPVVFKQL